MTEEVGIRGKNENTHGKKQEHIIPVLKGAKGCNIKKLRFCKSCMTSSTA